MTNSDFAYQYWLRGWFPIPLIPNEKRPAGRYILFNECSPDHDTGRHPESILAPWQSHPDLGVGLLLKPSGLAVVDCDDDCAVQEALSKSADTSVVITRQGAHLYYHRPQYCPAVRTTKRGASGKLDILANGYVVAPPSIHPSGHRYYWLGFQQSLPELPPWAVMMLSQIKQKSIVQKHIAPESVQNAQPINMWHVGARNPKVRLLLERGPAGINQDRSVSLWLCINTLIRLHYTDEQIARSVWFGPMGEKPRQKGWQWFCDEIARARLELLPQEA